MKGIIIYGSKYGATKQYAHWLANILQMPVSKAESVTPDVLALYDMIVIGSPVYIGKLVLHDWLRKNSDSLKHKKLFIFIVSSTNDEDIAQRHALIKNNFDHNISKMAKVFFLPGRCIVAKLSWMDRLSLKMGAWLEKDPEKKLVMKKGFDYMDRHHLDDIIAQIQRFADD
ncbi:Protoporphyrinogen IX oxidase, menaquinone-dependent (flavodoxin domain) [Mucilaginibacter gossypiicola]|uniref:Protoporphyrinogen IX oxidase, menaquinone-dependent (Flavodoxin domain) n=1 Tax=Mucilaginibacter gossypiicola TaxID=551995 RepID=A0A1H8AN65_9SPHI|nr:flavodoxin domain-containing protein [Mucilaginibacter gossypiicola]SEM70967.1 Protoporphyrinogen IX oxidase, menaquinone-dependent (flavodoxin domain) [Mucilaginibacter gossypiicola]